MILTLCEVWSCPPSQVLAEPWSSVQLTMIAGLMPTNKPEDDEELLFDEL